MWSDRRELPEGWLNYKPCGKRLTGTRFVAFKVPLKQSFTRDLAYLDVFGPWELVDSVRRQNQELGMIIDLTNSSRYYGLEDIPDSLVYLKIYIAGQQIPSDENILNFKQAVFRFLNDNVGNDKLIGVHCTHGVNRTGYMICRYLIDVNEMDPRAAVNLFNSARGHRIERRNYLGDLQNGPPRSNYGMANSEVEPRRGLACLVPNLCLTGMDRDEKYDYGYSRFHQRYHHPVPHHCQPQSFSPFPQFQRFPHVVPLMSPFVQAPTPYFFPYSWTAMPVEEYPPSSPEDRSSRRHRSSRHHSLRSPLRRHEHLSCHSSPRSSPRSEVDDQNEHRSNEF